MCDLTFTQPGPPRRRYRKAVVVLTYAIGLIPSIKHAAFRFYYLPLRTVQSDRSPTVGHHRPHELRQRSGGSSGRDERAPPHVDSVFQRWPTLLVGPSKRYFGGPARPEILTRLIEEGVSVQVNNVANAEPVRKARDRE